MKIEDLTILFVDQNEINYFGRKHDLTAFIAETTDGLNNLYGAGNWLVIPTVDLPADFSVESYTIENDSLVRASAEQIAEREAAKKEAMASVEIAELRAYLTATDWAVVKCMEIGEPISDHYPELHTARNEARARINKLERGGGYART